MKLEIDNKTKYRTADIRRLFMACYKKSGIHRYRFYLKVQYQRGWVGGRATYNGNWMMIALKSPNMQKNHEQRLLRGGWSEESIQKVMLNYKDMKPTSNPEHIANTIMHEFQHTIGLRHKVMRDNFDTSWAAEYPLRLQEEKPKVKRDLVMERKVYAEKMLTLHEKKLKREENLVKKWSKKVEYYKKKKEE